MIKQSTTSRSRDSSLLTSATDDEIHVAQILLHIAAMIRILHPASALKWGAKKRRSRLEEAKSPPCQRTNVGVEETPPQPKAETAASPVTPLAFSPSESDEQRSKHLFHKASNKMSKEVYIHMIEELSQRRDSLRGDIGNVTDNYNKLIAYNSQLRAIKQEVLKKEEPNLETRIDGNPTMEFIPKNHKVFVGSEPHPQPFVEIDQRLTQFHNGLGLGLGSTNHVGSFVIPDLNVSAEEIFDVEPYQPLDWSRAIADRRSRSAEARRRRKDIIRAKSMTMRKACAFKFSRTR